MTAGVGLLVALCGAAVLGASLLVLLAMLLQAVRRLVAEQEATTAAVADAARDVLAALGEVEQTADAIRVDAQDAREARP